MSGATEDSNQCCIPVHDKCKEKKITYKAQFSKHLHRKEEAMKTFLKDIIVFHSMTIPDNSNIEPIVLREDITYSRCSA